MADSTIAAVVVSAHLAAGAAHHAGDADRAAAIGDEQRVRRQRPLDVVERLEPLARPCAVRTTIVPPLTAAASKAWIGLPSSSIT